MSRRKKTKKKAAELTVDPTYNSPLVEMLVNRVMKKGKKALAYKLVYTMMDKVAKETGKDAIQVLERAILNIKPSVAVKPRRVGGSTYQIPYEVKEERGIVLALRWLLIATRKNKGSTSTTKLSNEILDALNKTGSAVKRRNDVHRMAQANKAFARYRF